MFCVSYFRTIKLHHLCIGSGASAQALDDLNQQLRSTYGKDLGTVAAPYLPMKQRYASTSYEYGPLTPYEHILPTISSPPPGPPVTHVVKNKVQYVHREIVHSQVRIRVQRFSSAHSTNIGFAEVLSPGTATSTTNYLTPKAR